MKQPARTRSRRAPPEVAPARREEVIEAALALIAEHGIAGTSLRQLAAELGMSQPSLYHYFPSKKALIEQILQHCAQKMLEVPPGMSLPTRAEDVPEFAARVVLGLYAGDRHPRFVRFIFVAAIESKENSGLIRRVLEEQLIAALVQFANAVGKDAAEREELRHVLSMIVYSLGFMLLEQRALMGLPEASPEVLRYAEWVSATGKRLLLERRRKRGGALKGSE
jgi:AcrR family transcriptional regulator